MSNKDQTKHDAREAGHKRHVASDLSERVATSIIHRLDGQEPDIGIQ